MYDEAKPCGAIGSALNSLSEFSPKDKESSCRGQLEYRKASLSRQLAEIEEALSALDANPEIERVLTLVGRTVRF